MGNLYLSAHIDKIVCSPDGKVVMRTCKLGAMPETVELFSDLNTEDIDSNNSQKQTRGTPRVRGRLRVDDCSEDADALVSMANFAADPNRFADLSDEWFWFDKFQVPDKKPSWSVENAERVFLRRQEAKLSYAKLAKEFGKSKPTIMAAVRHYLDTHPDAKDEVNLASGGQRPPKFPVEEYCDEARQLWESGWSKLKVAEKFGCSAPTVDKILAFTYEKDGLLLPTRDDLKNAKAAEARKLLDAGHSLDHIKEILKVSDVTARGYLKSTFAAEGKTMPDLRRRRDKP